jgi:hypothetical protein
VNILLAMQDAKFVQINGRMFVAGYSCDPDGALVADDIVLEASAADGELELTSTRYADAVELEPDAYRLRSGLVLHFLRPPTIH